MDERIINAEIADQKSGQWLGFIALIIVFVCALLLFILGNNIGGGAFLGAGVLGTIPVFVMGRNGGDKNGKEHKNKQ